MTTAVHDYWRCRTVDQADVEVVAVEGDVYVSSTESSHDGRLLEAGQLVMYDSVLHLGSGAAWQGRAGGQTWSLRPDVPTQYTLLPSGPVAPGPPATRFGLCGCAHTDGTPAAALLTLLAMGWRRRAATARADEESHPRRSPVSW